MDLYAGKDLASLSKNLPRNCNSSGNMTTANSCRKQSIKNQHYMKCISLVFLLSLCVSSELITFLSKSTGHSKEY